MLQMFVRQPNFPPEARLCLNHESVAKEFQTEWVRTLRPICSRRIQKRLPLFAAVRMSGLSSINPHQ